MSKVHIVQLLCPQRHCIVAAFWEEGESCESDAIKFLDAQRAKLKIDPWCGICHSRDLKYESKPTRFNSTAEAVGPMMVEQVKNLLAHAHFQRHKSGGN